MHNFTLFDRDRAEQAASEGKKLMLFVVDEEDKPLCSVGSVRYSDDYTVDLTNKYVEKAKEYIEDNYYKDIRLDDLAQFCGVSVSHLSRLFATHVKSTVTEYILSFRMNRAAYLLVNTDQSVVNIAREVGIQDCGYFNKRFRIFFGVTPLSYRKAVLLH